LQCVNVTINYLYCLRKTIDSLCCEVVDKKEVTQESAEVLKRQCNASKIS
jgi:hypothetical protein